MRNRLTGLHHVTAIAGDPQRNIDFYAGVLGLRLVKQTVNFDDPTTYHLYYGDARGTPGTILTFFAWPGARTGRQGTGQFGSVAFAVPAASLGYWIERLLANGIPHPLPEKRFGAPVLTFRDPDGLAVELVAVASGPGEHQWTAVVPAEHAIRRIHGVSLWQNDPDAAETFLTTQLGFERDHSDQNHRRLIAGAGSEAATLDLVGASGFWEGVVAVGSIHHVAWRTRDDDQLNEWRSNLIEANIDVTPVRDRFYFRSIYFDEPGGALFEIATDVPGFTIDEPEEALGSSLQFPPSLERDRAYLQSLLPPIQPSPRRQSWDDDARQPRANEDTPARERRNQSPGEKETVDESDLGFKHQFYPGSGSGPTLLLLHGTGGDETSLLELGEAIAPGAALLSPRGKVLEGGAPRFFRRLAEGVLDIPDLKHRTVELADFVWRAADGYGFDVSRVIAVGFSNGANIAASMLLLRPEILRAAVLFRPMLPFQPDATPDLAGRSVLIRSGRLDPLVPEAQVEELATALRNGGADVTLEWHPGGHNLTYEDVQAAGAWLQRQGLLTSSVPG